eukprot:tig00021070_g17929.t1
MQHCGVPPGIAFDPPRGSVRPLDRQDRRHAELRRQEDALIDLRLVELPGELRGGVGTVVHLISADGPESGPSVELGAARVADVVARVLVPQTCRREHVGDDRRLELCLVDLLEAAEPAVQRGLLSFRIEGRNIRLPSVQMFSFPSVSAYRASCSVSALGHTSSRFRHGAGLVPRLRARRRRRRRVQGYAQVLLGLGAQLLAEETWVLVLDRLHAGLAEELLASLVFIQSGIVVLERHPPSGPLRPRRDFVSRLSPATRYVSGSPPKLKRRAGIGRGLPLESGLAPVGFGVRAARYRHPVLKQGNAASSWSASASKTATKVPGVHLTLRAPPGSEAMADARVPALRIGLALLQRILGGLRLQVSPARGPLLQRSSSVCASRRRSVGRAAPDQAKASSRACQGVPAGQSAGDGRIQELGREQRHAEVLLQRAHSVPDRLGEQRALGCSAARVMSFKPPRSWFALICTPRSLKCSWGWRTSPTGVPLIFGGEGRFSFFFAAGWAPVCSQSRGAEEFAGHVGLGLQPPQAAAHPLRVVGVRHAADAGPGRAFRGVCLSRVPITYAVPGSSAVSG